MTDQDYINLINGVIALARPVSADEVKIDTLDIGIADAGLDSLDYLMVGIYLSDVFGLTEEQIKEMKVATVREMLDYMLARKTKEPSSVEEALKSIQ
jgi:acyl carrier protein